MGGIAGQIQQITGNVGQTAQQPGQVQPIGNPFAGLPLNDPLNRGGMPFQGFNPAGTDAGPRPFVSPYPLQPQQSGQVPGYVLPYIQNMINRFPQVQGMLTGQPQMPQRPGFGGDQVYAGGNPNFDERTGTFINPQRPPVIQPGPNVFPRPQGPQQRGLGGLQLNKFRNRLGQR